MAETFYFEIIASDKKFYSGACEHVIFPAVDGLYGVLANHEDTVTAVVAVSGKLVFFLYNLHKKYQEYCLTLH